MLLLYWQDFFPDHMVSVSSETNGMVDDSQLIQVSGSFCLQCTLFALECQLWGSQPLSELLCYLQNLLHTPIHAHIFLHPTQTFLNSSTCPEVHGHLHAKEQSKKSWKKFYFVLRRSGLYFSNKGTSKVSDKKMFTIYVCILEKSKAVTKAYHMDYLSYSTENAKWNHILICNCMRPVHNTFSFLELKAHCRQFTQ